MAHMQDKRPHRGRGDQRPCDVCRKRKARCVIRDDGACERCKRIRRACTFDDPPRLHTPRRTQPHPAQAHATSAVDDVEGFGWDDTIFLSIEAFQPELHHPEPSASDQFSLVEAPQARPAEDPFQSGAFILGPSSDPDPFFRGRYNFNADGYHQATLRGYQRAASQDDGLLFAITPARRTESIANTTTSLPHEPLVATLEPFTPKLYQLFDKFLYPVFPLPVSSHEQSSSSTLGAAVCAAALTWRSHDASLPWAPFETTETASEPPPPDVNRLYNYVWAGISREMHSPSYETIQAALLLIERRIPLTHLSDSPFNSCLQASITSMALSLGLNRNADAWEFLSDDQKQERRILWWLIFIEDKWVSAAAGKPTTIRNDDYDVTVPMLTFTGSPADIHFGYLLSLTFILQDILDTLMNWRFWARQTISIQETIDKVEAFVDRLQTWRDSLGQNLIPIIAREAEGPALGVLIVAYLYCNVLIHKALLRVTEGSEYFPTAFQSALRFSSILSTELGTIGVADFTSFWFSWSHSHFNAFSEFMPYLISLAPTAEDRISAKESAARLRQWLFSHGKYIDLVRVAMIRLDLCQAAIDAGKVRLSNAESGQLFSEF